MLQRDGHPTALGEAIAMYGRIPKTLHICSLAAEEAYRRDIKGMRNLQEGRHALAGKTFHGKKGELYQRYHEGMEDPLTEITRADPFSDLQVYAQLPVRPRPGFRVRPGTARDLLSSRVTVIDSWRWRCRRTTG
jgi:hypothetical protein